MITSRLIVGITCAGCLIPLSGCLGLSKLSLLNVAVLEHLEEDGKEDKAEVRVANNLPGEAVKETDFVADNGRWASFLTERAGTVSDIRVAIECFIFTNGILTRQGL